MKNKILNYENIAEIIKEIKKQNKKIVFCTGCFDILQSGHAVFFNQCKEYGEVLIVGVGKDKVVKELKGENRPINPENNRIFLVSSMENVDYAILNGEKILPGKIDFYEAIEKIRPDFFVLNDNDSAIKEKRELCEKLGIELKLVPRIVPDYLKPTSSTEIINKMKEGN